MATSKQGARTRVLVLVLIAAMAASVPAASAADEPVISEPQPIDDSVIAAPSPASVSAEVVVYDMYFPIQGGASYTNNFGDCRGGPSCPRTHEGIDILKPKMTPVLAVSSGYVGWMHNDQGGDCCAFEINHDDGWESWYIHLNNDTPGTDDGQGWGFAPGVEPGARIEAGQLIGWVGDSGNAEGSPPHLHFELHKPGGIVVNPYHSLQAATVLNAPLGHGKTGGCDFDGDGYDDLAIGVPGEDLNGSEKADAGAVTVIYGSANGLSATGAHQITQGSPGVDSKAKAGEQFGFATACGDVNGDEIDDLVVGVPGEAILGKANAGAINIILGSENGLVASGDNFWNQRKAAAAAPAEVGDRFGEALTVDDFDDDGYADVAVGAPGEKINGKAGAGMVAILYGSAAGLDGTSAKFSEATAGIGGAANPGDNFGAALASGDFDGNGFADLLVGIPGEDGEAKPDAGAVMTIYGGGSGLSSAGAKRFSQATAGIVGIREAGEQFGFALVAADFDDDERDDVAIGVPSDMHNGVAAGGVNVIYGSGSGLSAAGDKLFRQDAGGIQGDSLAGDRWGIALAIGDFDANGKSDLAVGSSLEDLGALVDGGAVIVIYASENGLAAAGNQLWSQNTDGINGEAEEGDRFGRWLSSGDFAGTGISSLAVGVPAEDVGAIVDAGTLHIIKGSGGTGLTSVADQQWGQGATGIPNTNEAGDGFGRVGSIASA